MLNEVVNAEDPDPNQRLTNTIAKRRAKRGAHEGAAWRSAASSPAAALRAGPPHLLQRLQIGDRAMSPV